PWPSPAPAGPGRPSPRRRWATVRHHPNDEIRVRTSPRWERPDLESPRNTPCSVPSHIGRQSPARPDPPRSRPPRGGTADAQPGAPPHPPTGRRRPLEPLEARLVLSASHVSTLAAGGAGSLRTAVDKANTHAGADVVVFDDGLTGTTALTGGELDVIAGNTA